MRIIILTQLKTLKTRLSRVNPILRIGAMSGADLHQSQRLLGSLPLRWGQNVRETRRKVERRDLMLPV